MSIIQGERQGKTTPGAGAPGAGKASFTLGMHNPDVLTCIANLSNDEVFTPPAFANEMLDTLAEAWAKEHDGRSIWSDPTVTFLDPFTKSGVFLREITQRLTDGLAQVIPDLQRRVDHILTQQVFGIGITGLTALLARRSVYCTKDATGRHSIAKGFDRDWGNIWFERTEHAWVNRKKVRQANPLTNDDEVVEKAGTGKCRFCGAAEAAYARDDVLETHAYAFIHTDDIKSRLVDIFGVDMQFDVIIGNPPYQLSDGGGTGSSASPIYQHFIEQARHLDPRFISMIIPAKWFSGGKGLDDFRFSMLNDRRIRNLVDYPDSRDAFTGVDIAGGVCYFLWAKENPGPCEVETVSGGSRTRAERLLNEHSVFVRDNRALNILKKVQPSASESLASLVSPRRPFGIDSNHQQSGSGDLLLYASGNDGRISRADVPRGDELIDRWKVLLSKTSSEHAGQTAKDGRRKVLSRIEVMPPASVATESYLVIGPFDSQEVASHVTSYLRSRFARFLVSLILLTQNITRSSFNFVPLQDFSHPWTDADLYAKYGITSDEIAFIESMIRPMELDGDSTTSGTETADA